MKMKSSNIIRRYDDLGRIVIPRKVREEVYGCANVGGKPIEIFYMKDGTIILKPIADNLEEEQK